MAKEPVVIRKRLAPSVPLTLEVGDEAGNKEVLSLRLSFDFNALALVEEFTGISLLSGKIFNQLNATNLSLLLWASMLQNHPEYTGIKGLEAIRTYMTLDNAKVVEAAVSEAFILCLPPEQREAIRKATEEAAAEAARKLAAGEAPAAPSADPLVPTPAQ